MQCVQITFGGAIFRALNDADVEKLAQSNREEKTAVKGVLEGLGHRLGSLKSADPADLAQARYYADLILNPNRDGIAAIAAADTSRDLNPPPGMPIGASSGEGEDCWFCETTALNR